MRRPKIIQLMFIFFISCSAQQHNETLSEGQWHIIFDCNGVLFKENKVAFARKLGMGNIARYTLSHLKNPIEVCLESIERSCTLDGQKPHTDFTFMNKKMPECIVLWQEGRKSFDDMNKELKACIKQLAQNNHFKSVQEHDMVTQVLDLALHPENLHLFTKPDKTMFRLVEELKMHGHRIYMLTNMAPEPLVIMKKKFPDEFAHFDGICTSGSCGILVPENKMFIRFLEQKKLDPRHCIFIDDEPKHIEAAQKCGIQGIIATNARALRTKLKKHGI